MKPVRLTLLLVLSLVALSSCGSGQELFRRDSVAYQLNTPLVTLNAASSLGVVSDAARISSRLFPGAFIDGPHGEEIPNPEIVSTQPDSENPAVIHYSINPAASFSDGTALTCTDFLMTSVAGKNRELFHSMIPLWDQIESLNCESGASTFDVIFKEGLGYRYRDIFNAGTVLPAQYVGNSAGIDDIDAILRSDDPEQLENVASAWNSAFLLTGENAVDEIPTLGPYYIESYDQGNELHLAPNPEWAGDEVKISNITIYPATADTAKLARSGRLVAQESLLGSDSDFSPSDLDAEQYGSGKSMSRRVDQLVFTPESILTSDKTRNALAGIIDHQAIAQEETDQLGVEILPAWNRLFSPSASGFESNQSVVPMNIDYAREVLQGNTLSVAYRSDLPHHKIIIDNLSRTASEAGFALDTRPIDLADPDKAQNQLTGSDMILVALSPDFYFPQANVDRNSTVTAIQAAEQSINEQVPTLPIAAEPYGWIVNKKLYNVIKNPGDSGFGWNVDRWTFDADSEDE